LSGDTFTMGDIPFGCELQRYMRVPIERPKMPHVDAYFERLRERPAFTKHVDIPLT
jgi:glutathione S-transferase